MKTINDWKNYAKIAIVLGSGLNQCIHEFMNIEGELSYREIEGMKVSTAPGHIGKFLFGTIEGVPVIAMQGRLHFYEGYSMDDVTMPIVMLHQLGVETLIVTNASGGINLDFNVGEFMLITDHINLTGTNPLIGPKREGVERFPDMSYAYNRNYIDIMKKIAEEQHIPMQTGVYIGVTGPSYETPAEIRAFRVLGADAVGMSTVAEVIVANQMHMQVCGLSLISNMAAGVLDQKLTEEEVLEAGRNAHPQFKTLLTHFIRNIGE